MRSYFKRGLYGVGIAMVFSVIASLVSYGLRVYLARALTPTEYGLFYSVFTFVLFFLFFRDLGLGTALSRYIARFRVNNEVNKIKTGLLSVLSIQLLGSGLLVALLFLFLDFLSTYYFKSPEAGTILMVLSIYIIGSVLLRTTKSVFQGFEKMVHYSSVESTKNVLTFVFVLVFVFLGYGALAPALAYAIVGLLVPLLYSPFVYKIFPFFRHKIVSLKEMTLKLLRFGTPVVATSISGKIVGYLDTLILTYFVSSAEVGIYNVVLPSALLFLFMGRSITSVFFPMSSELWKRRDKTRIAQGLQLIYRFLFAVTVPLVVIVGFFSSEFITLFFGMEYAAGKVALQILLFGVLFYVTASVNNNVITAIGKPKYVAAIVFISAALNVFLNFLLIPAWGILGAAFSTSFSYLTIFLLSSLIISKTFAFKWKKQAFLTLLAGLVLLALLFFSNFMATSLLIKLVVILPLGVVFYFLLLHLLKVFTFIELKKYWKLLRK